MRPGHPALLATYSPTTPSTKQLSVFGLPGNPCAAAATLRFMVLPFLSIAMGQSVELPSSKARISNVGPQKSIDKTHVSLDIRKGNPADSTTTPVTNGSTACGGASRKAGHRSYLLAQYAGYNDDGLRLVHTLDKGSGMVRPLSTAECWVLLKEGQGEEDDLLVDCYSI